MVTNEPICGVCGIGVTIFGATNTIFCCCDCCWPGLSGSVSGNWAVDGCDDCRCIGDTVLPICELQYKTKNKTFDKVREVN